MKGILNREVTTQECFWLKKDLHQGDMVYKYSGYTYGVMSPNGVAVTDEKDVTPFYEIPSDAIDWIV